MVQPIVRGSEFANPWATIFTLRSNFSFTSSVCLETLQLEVGGTRQELEDLREICRAEIEAARHMASAVIKLFQTPPPVPPAAVKHVDEIGELFL